VEGLCDVGPRERYPLAVVVRWLRVEAVDVERSFCSAHTGHFAAPVPPGRRRGARPPQGQGRPQCPPADANGYRPGVVRWARSRAVLRRGPRGHPGRRTPAAHRQVPCTSPRPLASLAVSSSPSPTRMSRRTRSRSSGPAGCGRRPGSPAGRCACPRWPAAAPSRPGGRRRGWKCGTRTPAQNSSACSPCR
jgi:hypothetical protein